MIVLLATSNFWVAPRLTCLLPADEAEGSDIGEGGNLVDPTPAKRKTAAATGVEGEGGAGVDGGDGSGEISMPSNSTFAGGGQDVLRSPNKSGLAPSKSPLG